MALQHLRSSTANKRPTPAGMSDGQLALNTNDGSPGLFFKDSNGALVKVGPVHVGATAPNASPASGGSSGNAKGEQWLDTSGTNPVLKVWDGSAWQSQSGEFVNASGDVMTGALGIIAGTVSAPGLYFSGDTNTGLWSPGADQLALSTNGNQRLAIDSSGRVLVGPGTARAVGGAVVPTLAVETTGQAASLVRNSADTSGGILALGKSRGTAAGDNTAVQQDDILGEIRFVGANGTDMTSIGAHIRAEVAGEVGTAGDTSDMPSRLTFSTTPDGLASATQRLVIDSNGQIEAKSLGTAAAPVWSFVDDPNTGIYSPGADQVAISTNGTGRLFINSSGQIGVGTSPVSTFHVNGTGRFEASQSLICNGTNGTYATWLYNGTSVGDIGTANQAVSGGSNTDFAITTRSATNLIFGIGTGERMRLDSSGRLGLGSSSVSAKLHITSSSGGDDSGLRITRSDTGGGDWRIWSTADVNGEGGGKLIFGNTANRVTIDSQGRLAIGSSAPIAATHIMLSDVTGFSSPANDGLVVERGGGNDLGITIATNNDRNGYLLFADSDSSNPAWVGYDHSVNAMSFRVNASERARIDSSGRLLVGTSSSIGGTVSIAGGGLYLSANDSNAEMQLTRASANSGSPFYYFNKARGTYASPTVVSDGDGIGTINFRGHDGSAYIAGASISAAVDGTPGANDMPGRLVFSTTADGASSPTQRMRIGNTGDVSFFNLNYIYAETDNAVGLGFNGNRYTSVWAANGTIQTSDERAKTEINNSLLGSDFIKSLRPVSYKWIEGGKRDTGERDEDGNYIYESVPGERTHWGFIAQEVKQAVDAVGVDFGGWVLTDKDDPDSQQALRYDQFIAPLTKALQETMAELGALKAEVSALKAS